MLEPRHLILPAIALAGIALLLGLLWLFQRSLIYFPLPRAVPPAQRVLPGAQDVAFATDDGLTLGGWFVPADGAEPLATVLVFNGNGGDRSLRAPLAAALARQGYAVLLFDYRGYGGNPGSPSEQGLIADARAARAYLDSRAGVDPRRIVYFGESLGAAVAIALATAQAPAALVLRSPFTSLADMARLHYPLLPAGPLLRDRYPSIDRISQVRVPLLVIAGSADRIIPAEQSRRLFEAAAEPKQLLQIEGADHNDVALLMGADLIRAVDAFLDSVLSQLATPSRSPYP